MIVLYLLTFAIIINILLTIKKSILNYFIQKYYKTFGSRLSLWHL